MHEFIAKNGIISKGDVFVTSSVTARSFSGSLQGTSSWSISSSWAPTSTLSGTSYNISASWTSQSLSASYINPTIILQQLTASWALRSLQSNVATSSLFASQSNFAISASFASQSISASYSATASYVSNSFIHGGNSFGSTAILGTNDNRDLQVETNGVSRVVFDKNGNVTVGNISASSLLNVAGDISSSGYIYSDEIVIGASSVNPAIYVRDPTKSRPTPHINIGWGPTSYDGGLIALYPSDSNANKYGITLVYGDTDGLTYTRNKILLDGDTGTAFFGGTINNSEINPNFKIQTSGSIGPFSSSVWNLGSSGSLWKTLWVTEISASKITASLYGSASYALSSSWAPTTTLSGTSYNISASFASRSLSSSYINPTNVVQQITASWALNAIQSIVTTSSLFASQSNFAISASWASQSLSASYINPTTIVQQITSSWALNSLYSDNATFALDSQNSVSASYSNSASYINSSSYAKTSSYSNSSSYARTASYALNGGGGGTAISCSWASRSLSSSIASTANTALFSIDAQYAVTASYALNGGGGGLAISCSWASKSLSSSIALTANTALFSVDAQYAVTASYALNGGGAGVTPGGSYNISCSWASQSLSASYTLTSSYSLTTSKSLYSETADFAVQSHWSLSSSYSDTCSYALNGGGAGVTPGGSYNISASWASRSLSSSLALTCDTAVFALDSQYTKTGSYPWNYTSNKRIYTPSASTVVMSSSFIFGQDPVNPSYGTMWSHGAKSLATNNYFLQTSAVGDDIWFNASGSTGRTVFTTNNSYNLTPLQIKGLKVLIGYTANPTPTLTPLLNVSGTAFIAGPVDVGNGSIYTKLNVYGHISCSIISSSLVGDGVTVEYNRIESGSIIEKSSNYVLTDADDGRIFSYSGSNSASFVISGSGATAILSSNFNCTFYQSGSGQILFVSQSGTILKNRSEQYKTAGQYAIVSLIRINGREFVLGGDTSA